MYLNFLLVTNILNKYSNKNCYYYDFYKLKYKELILLKFGRVSNEKLIKRSLLGTVLQIK